MQKYHFLYDSFGNTTSFGIGGWNATEQLTLASYEYAAMNGLLTKQTYGNGDYVEFTYDILGRAKTTTYYDENENVDRVLTYVYTGDGQLYSIHDSKTGFLYLYTYDSIGRLVGSSVKNADGEILMSTRQEYNANNQLVGQHWTVGTTTYSETYTYDTTDGALTSYNNALGQTISLEYDALRRISKVDTTPLDRFYEYADGKESGQTTGLVSRYWYHTASYDDAYFKYSYSYDALGNISSYTQSGTTYTYTYDDQNQLLTQTGGGKTYTYTYDNAGNILAASNGTATNSYTYGNALWRDLLTAFNGQTITYDGSGNPLSYYNGKRYTFTWEEGRNLVSAVQGTNTYTYAYDSTSLRVSKTVNGVKHEYLYASGRLLRETFSENGEVTAVLDFVYDHNSHPFALRYTTRGTTTTYYYITNLQGDVLAMITGSGTVVASYSYDPYGKVLSATKEMADINPLRYRGYYYDAETGFYYLQSRYYDPAICRFINADRYASTGQGIVGCNMFAYCKNNPSNYLDFCGTDAIWIQEADSAEGFGHSGLLVQNEDETWYYFFWGPESDATVKETIMSTSNDAFFVIIDTEGYDMTKTEDVKAAILNSGAARSEHITSTYYFEGDYTATYYAAKEMVESGDAYNLLDRNCLQQTLDAFHASDWRFGQVAYGFGKALVPNLAVKKVAMLPSDKDEIPWKLIFCNIFCEQ